MFILPTGIYQSCKGRGHRTYGQRNWCLSELVLVPVIHTNCNNNGSLGDFHWRKNPLYASAALIQLCSLFPECNNTVCVLQMAPSTARWIYGSQTSPKVMNMVTSLTLLHCAATICLCRAFWHLLFFPSSLPVSQALPVAARSRSELDTHAERLRELKPWHSAHHVWLRQTESAMSNRSSLLVSRELLVYPWLLGCGIVQQLSGCLETT